VLSNTGSFGSSELLSSVLLKMGDPSIDRRGLTPVLAQSLHLAYERPEQIGARRLRIGCYDFSILSHTLDVYKKNLYKLTTLCKPSHLNHNNLEHARITT
jgi:hypothetical protein